MPYGRLHDDDVDAMLDYWYAYRGDIWIGIVSGDPFLVSDPLTVEVLGDAYRRATLHMTRVDTILRNSEAISWAVAPMTRVSGYAGWDGPFNGKPRFYTPLPEPVDYPIGGTHLLPARELGISLDS